MKNWSPTSGTEQLMLEDYCDGCALWRSGLCKIFRKWFLNAGSDEPYYPPEWKSKDGVYFSYCDAHARKEYKKRAARRKPIDKNQSSF